MKNIDVVSAMPFLGTVIVIGIGFAPSLLIAPITMGIRRKLVRGHYLVIPVGD